MSVIRALSLLLLSVAMGCATPEYDHWTRFGDLPDGHPRVFAPGMISTDDFEFAITLGPEMHELYFTRRAPGESNKIYGMQLRDGEWSSPSLAPFSNSTMDFEPHISPTGKKLYFGSLRALDEEPGLHQWFLEKDNETWTEPQALEITSVSGGPLMYVSSTLNEKLYFTVINIGDPSGLFYSAKEHGGGYGTSLRLEEAVNQTDSIEVAHPFIAPDESYLIYDFEGPRGYGNCDLYISFRQADGTWSEAVNLGAAINTEDCEMCSSVSPDGRFLFYHRGNDEDIGNIYWVDFQKTLAAIKSK